jgi:hypothetical protein
MCRLKNVRDSGSPRRFLAEAIAISLIYKRCGMSSVLCDGTAPGDTSVQACFRQKVVRITQ